MDFIFTYHPLWLLLTTFLSVGLTSFLYYRDELLEEVSRNVKWLLAICRFGYIWTILFLLLGIVLESFEEQKEKPIVFVAHDDSESIAMTGDSSYYRSDYVDKLKQLGNNLSEKFEVAEYSFSDGLEDGIKKDYTGKTTNISTVFESIFDRYTNRNIGAIVLSTDGIYNTGSNPVYEIARKSYLPVFTIGLGDTNVVRDIRIDEVKHNDIAFLGNQFPVEVVFSATKCEGETADVAIYEGDQKIDGKRFNFSSASEQSRLEFQLKADRTGFRKYSVRISAVDNEFSVKNNIANFYVEVIDGRQKVLLAEQGPHPDINALRFVIGNNKNYEVENKPLGEVDAVQGYDLVVLHNYVPGNPVIDEAIDRGTVPILFIVGISADTRALSAKKIGFGGRGSQTEDVGFGFNPNFKEILISPAIVQLFSGAPPLNAPFGNYTFSSAIEILAYQKVGNIQLDNPLIYFTKKGASRFGVILGEGIWRWRLYDQMKNGSTKNFEEFFSKMVTYLAVKENKDPFRIQIGNEFSENENVIVEAELYNQSFELINEPEVKLEYTDEEGKSFESFFVRSGSAYRLDLGKLKAGLYNWTANTVFQGKNYSKSGTFLVKEIKLELLNVQANHRLLHNLADNSGGKFYLPTQLGELQKEIETRDDLVTVVYQEKAFDDLIDKKWLFFLIMALIAVEWFIRKYQGAY